MNSFLQNKKILITGGAGFLGKHLFRKLLEYGIEENNIFTSQFPEHDLRRYEDCLRIVQGKDIVIHLAGVVGSIEFNRKYPGKVFYDNAAMSINIIEASRHIGVEKFIGIGSAGEYPKHTSAPFKEESLWDGYPEETSAPYGLAKKFMLVQSQAYRIEYGLNAVHLLMINLYGPEDNFNDKSSHVIAALIKKIHEAQKEGKDYIEVWGTGEQTREFLYVEDAAEGIVLATEKYNKPEPINIGSGEEILIRDLANMVARLMDFRGEIRWDTTKPNGQPRRVLNTARAKQEFGFEAKTNLAQGLKRMIQWVSETNIH